MPTDQAKTETEVPVVKDMGRHFDYEDYNHSISLLWQDMHQFTQKFREMVQGLVPFNPGKGECAPRGETVFEFEME